MNTLNAPVPPSAAAVVTETRVHPDADKLEIVGATPPFPVTDAEAPEGWEMMVILELTFPALFAQITTQVDVPFAFNQILKV